MLKGGETLAFNRSTKLHEERDHHASPTGSGKIEENYKKFGICSLAGSRDNLLMWAHYGGQHTGFVVGLSVPIVHQLRENLARTKRGVLDLVKVNYAGQFPNANFFEAMLDIDNSDYTAAFFATKSVHWRYEEEHRLVYWGGPPTIKP